MLLRADHPLDPLVVPSRWRLATALSVGLIALGFFLATASLLDTEVIGAAFGGTTYDRPWEEIVEAARTGIGLMLLGTASLVGCSAGWALSAWVEGIGGPYWALRSGAARRLLATRGVQAPAAHRVLRAAMELEERAGGWRPETVTRFLQVSLDDPEAPVEREWLDEIRAWSVALRVRADDALRSRGSVHRLPVGGVPYEAEDVATLTERIDGLIRDLRFKGR